MYFYECTRDGVQEVFSWIALALHSAVAYIVWMSLYLECNPNLQGIKVKSNQETGKTTVNGMAYFTYYKQSKMFATQSQAFLGALIHPRPLKQVRYNVPETVLSSCIVLYYVSVSIGSATGDANCLIPECDSRAGHWRVIYWPEPKASFVLTVILWISLIHLNLSCWNSHSLFSADWGMWAQQATAALIWDSGRVAFKNVTSAVMRATRDNFITQPYVLRIFQKEISTPYFMLRTTRTMQEWQEPWDYLRRITIYIVKYGLLLKQITIQDYF